MSIYSNFHSRQMIHNIPQRIVDKYITNPDLPWENSMAQTYKGKYFPKNPKKYRGNVNDIIYRSLWERTIMVRLDTSDTVVEWSSEEIQIPYRYPVDKRIHMYFPDMFAKIKKSDGAFKCILIEIKPYAQTQEPKKRKRVTKGYLNEVTQYIKNQAKWNSARAYCADKLWEFVIMTENEIFPKKAK